MKTFRNEHTNHQQWACSRELPFEQQHLLYLFSRQGFSGVYLGPPIVKGWRLLTAYRLTRILSLLTILFT